MSEDFEVKAHSNQVLDLKGTVVSSQSTLSISKPHRPEKRPDVTGIALLQAKHMLYEAEDVTAQALAAGVNLGVSSLQASKYRLIKIHYYAWGLFWTTLLKALKNRQDLKDWSPHLFMYDTPCESCSGEGRTLYKVGSPEYDAAFNDFKDFQDEGEEPTKYGVDIGVHCTPCHGVGYTFHKKNKL